MDVATFGSACSPCSAQFIKNLNAEEFKHLFPTATEAIIHGTYVDDFLDSRNTEEEIIRLVEEVKYVHSQGGFEIRNFVSNSTIVLSEIGEVNAPPSKDLGLLTSEKALSVLGIRWFPKLDIFTFTLNLPQLDTRLLNGMLRPTKRQVLSTVMSLYDPLGMLAAFVVHGKIIIQTLWKTGCKWDEPVDDSTFANWKRWTNLFSRLGEVRISRPYFGQGSPETCQPIQMHTFVDASKEAYACVIYFRYFDRGFPRCTLVGAKSKVAPVKPLSIPRLELLAAVLGTRMANYIQENHQLSISQRFYWTDSSTVLHWIHADARKYNSYIACRIGEILTSTNLNEWRWVSSRDNVADEATKWGHGPCFEESSRWFHAPEFLWELESTWPEQKWQAVNVQEELRSSCFHHQTSKELLVDYTRFSKWERIHRTIAYVFRICTRKEDDQVIPLEYLKQEHLKKAELELIRIIQRETFHDEIAVLQKCRNGKRAGAVPIASPLYKLSAYIEEEEIVRMDSRIGAAPNLPIEAKCPIILAKNHRLTFLLVDFYHRRYLHRNHETVFNELRQQFYVPGLRKLIRTVTARCQWCKVYHKIPTQPKMGPLPRARLVAFQRPFTFVGLDYFGPLFVKVKRSHAKRWIALFTCLTTRAVHMEVAHSLSTTSCKMCIRRFIARRGAPAEIYSDNGTNFRGAANELREQLLNINQRCAESFTNTNTKWVFNPPAAPHTGGVWERLVRSVKTALECFHDAPKVPDDETLETIILEAENIVNSRPLTYIPLDSTNQEALTPNHFLLGSSTGAKMPSQEPVNPLEGLRNSWNLARTISDSFWKRWLKEYLPTIARRTKWFEKTKPLEPGDLVFVADEKRRNSWIRGQIEEVYPGKDGEVRQAMVRTNNGRIRRAAGNLAVIDVVDDGKTELEAVTSSYAGGNVTATIPSGCPIK
ncbi:uncharacterized protein LOC129741647 [Uranotaenia lowii]|uniref:uncharacterized protein LOC129741647 n=1 Tax=Uranotaenia lowii TaxID=190385 RepID=UPI00247B046F|nr:uncharacterized protein LOC129741647 [Uranotaenia lowii]